MKRPVGVVLTAIIGLLGSLALLALLAIEILAFMSMRASGVVPRELEVGLRIGLVIFTILAVWGITSAIGLLLLRNWARISTIIFSALMAVMSLFSAPMIFIVPKPPNAPPGFSSIMIGIAAFYLALGILGVVWIVYFTRPSTRAAFAGAVEAESVRPLSISIIAWIMIGSGLISLPMSFLRMPVALLGVILTGWSATAGMIVLALAYVLIGYGLLHLKPEARIAGIALFALFALNGLVFAFVPNTHAKLMEAMKGSPFFVQPAGQPMPPPLPSAFMLLTIPMMAVPLWFLVTRRKAFEEPPIGAGGSGSPV